MSRLRFVSALLTGCLLVATTSAYGQHLSLDAAAGGGFVGVDTATIETIPNTICDKSTPPKCTVDADNVVAVRNTSYAWQPALAVGLVFRYVFSGDKSQDGAGIGLGGQFVFVPHGTSSRAAPAITLHIGTQSKQVFFGAVFLPTDTVEIPGGGDRAVVPTGFQTNSFLRPDSGSWTHVLRGNRDRRQVAHVSAIEQQPSRDAGGGALKPATPTGRPRRSSATASRRVRRKAV